METTTQDIVVERTLNAPVSKVWKALTDVDQMRKWYFDIAKFKPEAGFEFSFIGGDEKQSYKHLCRVVEAMPNKKLAYTWSYEIYPGIETLVIIELTELEQNKTHIKLTHQGVGNFPTDNPSFKRDSFVQGWTYIVGTSLKNFVEGNNA